MSPTRPKRPACVAVGPGVLGAPETRVNVRLGVGACAAPVRSLAMQEAHPHPIHVRGVGSVVLGDGTTCGGTPAGPCTSHGRFVLAWYLLVCAVVGASKETAWTPQRSATWN